MQQSKDVVIFEDVLNDLKATRQENETNGMEEVAPYLLHQFTEKLNDKKKHHKDACKGCDGICCKKKGESEISITVQHKKH